MKLVDFSQVPETEWVSCAGLCGQRYMPDVLVDGLCPDCCEQGEEPVDPRLAQVPVRYRPALAIDLDPRLAAWDPWSPGASWSMTLHGPPACGKSFQATALWWRRRGGERSMWCDWQTVAHRLRAAVGARESTVEILETLGSCSLLLLDDVRATNRASGRDTEFVADSLRWILCQRYDWWRPTILTMDKPPETMEDRIASRLSRERGGTVIRLADYRHQGG